MKLGEALSARAAKQRRIGELRQRIAASAVTTEDEQPPESAQDLIVELETVTKDLEGMIVRINLTNATAKLDDERSITAALARRDSLASLRTSYTEAADAADRSGWSFRSRASELKQERHVDVAKMRKQAEDAGEALRVLDARIQAANWTTDLVGL